MHSEAKQTETAKVGAEKSLLQGHARRKTGWLILKNPNSLVVFRECDNLTLTLAMWSCISHLNPLKLNFLNCKIE